MNLHDFVAEPVNTVHSFHDAHTVPFCLTADHISTCLMMSSARFKAAQFWSVLIRGEWKCSICSYQRRLVWRTVTENWCGQSVWWKRGSFHGVPWTAQFWMRGWWSVSTPGYGCSGMHRLSLSSGCRGVSTAGHGCSGMHRLTVSRQLATDAVVGTVSLSVSTAGIGMPWTLDQVKYLFLSVVD